MLLTLQLRGSGEKIVALSPVDWIVSSLRMEHWHDGDSEILVFGFFGIADKSRAGSLDVLLVWAYRVCCFFHNDLIYNPIRSHTPQSTAGLWCTSLTVCQLASILAVFEIIESLFSTFIRDFEKCFGVSIIKRCVSWSIEFN
jgi:hypothetical protein